MANRPTMTAALSCFRMKAIVAADVPGLRLLPMSRVELFGVEWGWVEFHVAWDGRVVFAEDFLVVRVNFHSRGHPSAGHRAVIFKANLLEFPGISLRRLKQPHKQQPLLLHPELLGLQIAFLRSHHITRLSLPGFLVNLFEVVAFGG